MRLADYLSLTGKVLLLCIWLVPLAFFLYFQLVDLVLEVSAFLSMATDLAAMLLVLILAFLPAVVTGYALSTGSRSTMYILLFIGMIVWMIPMNTYHQVWHSLDLFNNTFWYQIMQYWVRIFPLAVAGVTMLTLKINQDLIDLASYSQLPLYQLIWRYFLPLLSPGIWLVVAVLAQLIPYAYYTDTYAADAQLSSVIFALPLVLLAHKIDSYASTA